MKSDRVFLAEWWSDSHDSYNDIPWPMVHEWAGHDTVRWINSQNHYDCQMIIEKNTEFSQGLTKLFVEFYKPSLRTEFALRFAK